MLLPLIAALAVMEAPEPEAPRSVDVFQAVLDESINLHFAGSFVESFALLEKLLGASPSHPSAQTARLYLIANLLGLGNPTRAREVARRMLEIDPDYTPPMLTSVAVRELLAEEARVFLVRPIVEHFPPRGLREVDGVVLDFAVRRLKRGQAPVVRFRVAGQDSYGRIDPSRSGARYAASIPLALSKSAGEMATLEYFVEVVDEQSGAVVSSLRDDERPFRVALERAPPQAPLTRQWWFWTAMAGGAAVVAGIIAGVAAGLDAASAPGSVRVNLVPGR